MDEYARKLVCFQSVHIPYRPENSICRLTLPVPVAAYHYNSSANHRPFSLPKVTRIHQTHTHRCRHNVQRFQETRFYCRALIYGDKSQTSSCWKLVWLRLALCAMCMCHFHHSNGIWRRLCEMLSPECEPLTILSMFGYVSTISTYIYLNIL